VTYNVHDGLLYMTAAEFAADVIHILVPTTKVYVYETGIVYVSDGANWHVLGEADT
jgi:hypothetical protein